MIETISQIPFHQKLNLAIFVLDLFERTFFYRNSELPTFQFGNTWLQVPTFNRINFRIKIQFRQKLNSVILAQELFYRNTELLTIGNKIISAKFLPIINVCFWQFCNCLFYHALHRKHIKKIGILPTQSWNLFRANNYTKHTVKNHTIYSFPYLDKNQ